MSTLNIVQTVELLNFASNGVSSYKDSQDNLTQFLNVSLNGGIDPLNNAYPGFFPLMNPQLAGGDWKVVWGPIAITRDGGPGEAINAMYCAYSANLSTMVVAIAATNPSSIYDWIAEDGDVSPIYMAKFPLDLPFNRLWHLPPFSGIPTISAATALGVSNLLSRMNDPVEGSLSVFLKKQANSNSTLIFTGHSLAGALAPTTALQLYSDPASSGWKAIYVLPSAGASPGNSHFADLFAAAYPRTASGVSAPYGDWNVDYANNRDIVPHAWNQLGKAVTGPDSKGNYPSFFGVIGPVMGAGMKAAILGAEVLSTGSYTYQNLEQTSFDPEWGTWQPASDNWGYPASWVPAPVYTDSAPLNNVTELGVMIEATHISQYIKFFEMVPPPQMPRKQTSGAADDPGHLHRQALKAAAKVS